MADDLNLFELDEARLTLLDSKQGARARSTSQAVDLSGPVVVGGRLDLSAEAEAEAVQVGLNYGDAYSEQVLSEAFALGIGSHQDSSWDVLLQPSDVDGLLKVTTGLGGSIEVLASASGRSDADGVFITTDASAIGLRDGDLAISSSAPLVFTISSEALTVADGANNHSSTNASAYGVDGENGSDPASTVVIRGNVEADALATAQLSGSGDGGIIEQFQADGVGVVKAEVFIEGTGFLDSSGAAVISIDGSQGSIRAAEGMISARGYGIESSTIVSDGTGDVDVIGHGSVTADFSEWAGFTGLELDQFVAMGFNDATVITGKGADHITGIATQNIQLSDSYLQSGEGASALAATLRQSAGINQSAIDTGAGDDQVSGLVEGTGVLDFNRGIVDSFVNVGSGNDRVRGAILDSVIHGGSGDDRVDLSNAFGSIVDGGSGNDRVAIDGTSEAMQLFGGTGDDIVIGGSGADDVSGGTGSDCLRGGKGADNFIFDVSSFGRGWDLVSDFNRAEGDKLQLASALTGIVKGSEAFFVDAAMAESTNRSTAFIYDTLDRIQGQSRSSIHMAYASDQGALMYDEDGDWTQGSTILAVVRGTGNGGLKSSDIEFV